MKNHRLLWRLLRIFVVLGAIALIVLALIDFRAELGKREYEQQLDTTRQIACYDGALVESKLENYVDTLATTAEILRHRELRDPQNTSVLLALEKYLNLQGSGLADTNGTLVTSTGRVLDVSDRMYFVKSMEGRDSVISNMAQSRLADGRMFAIGVPLREKNGEPKGFLYGFMALERFQELRDSRFHTTDQCIQVIDRKGEIILRAGQLEDPFNKFSNALEAVDYMQTEVPFERVKEAIAAGEDIQLEAHVFNSDNKFILYFTPLKLNGWYVMSILSNNEVVQRIETLVGDTVYQLVFKVILGMALVGLVTILYLIWERKTFQKDEMKLRNQLMAGTEGFMVIDLQSDTVTRCTASIVGQYNVGEMAYSQVIKRLVADRVDSKYREVTLESMSVKNMLNEFKRGITDIRTEYPICEKGEQLWRECSIHMEHDQDTGHMMAYMILKNVDAKKRHEILLTKRADNDYLTGLRNRRSAIEVIDQFLGTVRKDSMRTHAFLILDLDHFKSLNDTLGHQIGDQALKDVANVLTHHFREYDVISRLGGDEFVVFMKEMPMEIIMTNVDALLKKLNLHYEADGQSVDLTASVGVAIAPINGTDFEALYHKADRALYYAKEHGKNGFRIYSQADE